MKTDGGESTESLDEQHVEQERQNYPEAQQEEQSNTNVQENPETPQEKLVQDESSIEQSMPLSQTRQPGSPVVFGTPAVKKGDSTRFPVNELDDVPRWHEQLENGQLSNQHGRRCTSIGEKLMNYTYKQLRDLAGKFEIIVLKNHRKQDIIEQLEPRIAQGQVPSKERRRPGRRRGQPNSKTSKRRPGKALALAPRPGPNEADATIEEINGIKPLKGKRKQIDFNVGGEEEAVDMGTISDDGSDEIKKAKLAILHKQQTILDARALQERELTAQKLKKIKIENYQLLFDQYRKMQANLASMIESKSSPSLVEGLHRLLEKTEQQLHEHDLSMKGPEDNNEYMMNQDQQQVTQV